MYRKLSTLILIAIAVTLASFNTTHAASRKIDKVFIADYDPKVNSGTYYAAAYVADDTWMAIAITASKQVHYEDDLDIDSNGYVISSTLTLDSPTFTTNHHRFTWRALDDADIGTIANVVRHDDTGITDGTVNGDYAQFDSGFAVNGAMFLLREADPNSMGNAHGYIVQNGNLISYVVGNGEENPNDKPFKVLIPIVL